MTKPELIKVVCDECKKSELKVTQKEMAIILESTIEAIMSAVEAGEKVTLGGFGTFEVAQRAERTGRNPQTGEVLTIEAKKVPKFKAFSNFKERVNA